MQQNFRLACTIICHNLSISCFLLLPLTLIITSFDNLSMLHWGGGATKILLTGGDIFIKLGLFLVRSVTVTA